jgi:hypothetical protein
MQQIQATIEQRIRESRVRIIPTGRSAEEEQLIDLLVTVEIVHVDLGLEVVVSQPR